MSVAVGSFVDGYSESGCEELVPILVGMILEDCNEEDISTEESEVEVVCHRSGTFIIRLTRLAYHKGGRRQRGC